MGFLLIVHHRVVKVNRLIRKNYVASDFPFKFAKLHLLQIPCALKDMFSAFLCSKSGNTACFD